MTTTYHIGLNNPVPLKHTVCSLIISVSFLSCLMFFVFPCYIWFSKTWGRKWLTWGGLLTLSTVQNHYFTYQCSRHKRLDFVFLPPDCVSFIHICVFDNLLYSFDGSLKSLVNKSILDSQEMVCSGGILIKKLQVTFL